MVEERPLIEWRPGLFLSLNWLFDLQSQLIEHKFPYDHIAIHEYLISCAGDIYREMTHRSPYYEYIEEKWRTLMNIVRPSGLTIGDIEELKRLMAEPYYKPKRDEYLSNLETLRKVTVNTYMDSQRKQIMLASLDMISGLVQWIERLDPRILPKPQLDKLTEAIAAYFSHEFWRES